MGAMLKLLLVRHGETDWNREYRIQGHTDIPLNEKGRAEARRVKEELEGTKIDFCFSSPLKRTMETAEIILEGRDVPIHKDERIIEMCYGEVEGRSRHDELYLSRRSQFALGYPGGESYLHVAARVYPFLEEMKEKYEGKTILVVSHGGVSRVFESYFRGMGNEEFVAYGIPNCEVKEYDY